MNGHRLDIPSIFPAVLGMSAGQDDTVKHWDARLDVPQLRSGKISCSEHHLPLWVSVAQICKAQGDDSKLAQLLVFVV